MVVASLKRLIQSSIQCGTQIHLQTTTNPNHTPTKTTKIHNKRSAPAAGAGVRARHAALRHLHDRHLLTLHQMLLGELVVGEQQRQSCGKLVGRLLVQRAVDEFERGVRLEPRTHKIVINNSA